VQKAPPPAGPSVICLQQTLAFLAALLAAALLATLAGLRILLLLAGLLILATLLLAALLILILLIHFRPLCCLGRCIAKFVPRTEITS
jgi:hypothetical protein